MISPVLLGIILEKIEFLLTIFLKSTQITIRKLLVFEVCLNTSVSSAAGEVSALTPDSTFHHRVVFSCSSLNLLKFQHYVLKCLLFSASWVFETFCGPEVISPFLKFFVVLFQCSKQKYPGRSLRSKALF